MPTAGSRGGPKGLVTIADVQRLARRRLPRLIYDFVEGGSEDEVTLRRNRSAFEHVTFRPRMLTGVADRDLSTTVLITRPREQAGEFADLLTVYGAHVIAFPTISRTPVLRLALFTVTSIRPDATGHYANSRKAKSRCSLPRTWLRAVCISTA